MSLFSMIIAKLRWDELNFRVYGLILTLHPICHLTINILDISNILTLVIINTVVLGIITTRVVQCLLAPRL